MDIMELTKFAWSAIAGGVVGNAAYDGIKALMGAGFARLSGYAANNQQAEFEIALQAMLETNQALRDSLTQLAMGSKGGISTITTGNISTTGGSVIVGNGNRIG
ncbi:MAG: hypothetical protein ACK4RS_04540 [Thiothrix sp.]